MMHYLLIRYIIRILIYPLANPLIKAFFTAFYLDDYIRILEARLKNYGVAIKLGHENTNLTNIQLNSIIEKISRYTKILKELKNLIEKLNLNSLKKQFCQKIQTIIDIYDQLISCYSEYSQTKNHESINTNDCEDEDKRLKEKSRSISEDYEIKVEKLYEIYLKNISKFDYIKIILLGFTSILDFFINILKIDYANHVEYLVDQNEMLEVYKIYKIYSF